MVTTVLQAFSSYFVQVRVIRLIELCSHMDRGMLSKTQSIDIISLAIRISLNVLFLHFQYGIFLS